MSNGVEYFIAKRTSRGEKRGGGGVMMPVAKVAVAMSIAVMVITLAVILGFKRDIESKLTSLSGDILLTSIGGGSVSDARPINRQEELITLVRDAARSEGVSVERVAPFASRAAILRTSEFIEGVIAKGLTAESDMALFEMGLVSGELPDFGSETPSRSAIISKILANEAGYSVGDRIELLVTGSDGEVRRDLYKVGAIYTQGLGEAEKRLVICDMRNIQRINGWGESQISGYELWISDLSRTGSLSERINQDILFCEGAESVAAYSVQSLYPSIFDWLAAHDVNGVVVVSIMLIVAIFNIITVLLILVLERSQLIGLLKVFGMDNGSIRRIFLYRALSIATWGILVGNGVAIALCLAQKHLDIVKLDEAGYMLSSVPIDLSFWWLALLNVGVVVVIALLVIFPTRMVSSIEPSNIIQ